ncbi:MAG: peptidylprolyl isomerase [Firmicutes bacterium]|nr:peptidylprolyl isomerase [Bacillota bacterium]
MTKVTIELKDKRKINLDIDTQNAPISAENFIKLCGEGFYEGLCFHRVIDGFMIQGGGFKVEGEGKNSELVQKEGAATIKGEFESNNIKNPIKHKAGVISMARTMVKDSASSQFFICAGECSYLDGQYAAFGKVSDEGSMAVVLDIAKTKTGRWMHYDDVPLNPIVIEKCTVVGQSDI